MFFTIKSIVLYEMSLLNLKHGLYHGYNRNKVKLAYYVYQYLIKWTHDASLVLYLYKKNIIWPVLKET